MHFCLGNPKHQRGTVKISSLALRVIVLAACSLCLATIARAEDQLLAKYCIACHEKGEPEAALNLAALKNLSPFRHAAMWHQIRKRLVAGEMPPDGETQPTNEERKRLITFAEDVIADYTLNGHPDPGPLNPRRLNVREHMNVFRDLAIPKDRAQPRRAKYETKKDGSVNLYHAIIPPPEHPCAFVARALPPDTRDGGFDSIGENLSIPPFLMEKYFRASRKLLDDCFSLRGKDEHGRYQWRLREAVEKAGSGSLPRGIKTRREVVLVLLQDFASRAFRRPVTAEEAEKYARLFDLSQSKGEDFESSIRLALQAILVSPHFVILWADDQITVARSASEAETGNVHPEDPSLARRVTVRPLDDYGLATRLSIFLWSSIPDRELSELAEQGKLQDNAILEQQVRRMLNDQRITDGLHPGFLCQWLQLDHLDRSAPDSKRYPQYFQDNLAELMKQELLLFTDVMLVEDRSILEFIDADWGFVCYPLAQHYGIENFKGKKPPNNAAPSWYRIQFSEKRRGGVLTMGKVLTGTSQPTRTSPVHRGKWILETILGAPPPPPPPDVDNVLKEESAGEKRA